MTTQAKNAYRHVHGCIANGSLAPGDVISETAIAKELGCSRTPIGEALRRLAEDGLVQQVPRYGTIVREISANELLEHFEVREALETFAVLKAAERIGPRALNDLDTLCGRIDQEIAYGESEGFSRIEGDSLHRLLAADMAFHLLIISAAGNQKLLQVAHRTGSVAQIFQARRGNHTIKRVKDANSMHRAILDALRNKDGVQASQILTKHIRFSAEISVEVEQRTSGELASLSGLDLPDYVKEGLSASKV